MKLQKRLCPQQWPKSVFMCCLIGHTRLKFFSVWRLPLTQIQIPVKKGNLRPKNMWPDPAKACWSEDFHHCLKTKDNISDDVFRFSEELPWRGHWEMIVARLIWQCIIQKKYNRILTLPKVHCALFYVGWGGGGSLFMFPLRRIQNINSGSHRQRGYHEKTLGGKGCQLDIIGQMAIGL